MKVADYLTKEEIARFTHRSDHEAFRLFGITWAKIIAILFLVGAFPHPVVIVLGMFLLAGQQLGLAVLMHECSHRSLFQTSFFNYFCGQWFAAHWVLADLRSYGKGHLDHHRLVGTVDDPDLPNYQAYPISKGSFYRKVLRDLLGLTGIKFVFVTLFSRKDPISRKEKRPGELAGIWTVQILWFLLLWLIGFAYLYVFWMATLMTTYMLFIRLRQIAEHAGVDNFNTNALENTRTVSARGLAKWTLAPNNVNYHLEHHLLPSVPAYHLRALHERLLNAGAYQGANIARSYRGVFRRVLV